MLFIILKIYTYISILKNRKKNVLSNDSFITHSGRISAGFLPNIQIHFVHQSFPAEFPRFAVQSQVRDLPHNVLGSIAIYVKHSRYRERWCPEDAEVYVGVSGRNACAGGFNRGRGRGHGDSIVSLQLGLVRVSRLAANCAPLRREYLRFPFCPHLPISIVARETRDEKKILFFVFFRRLCRNFSPKLSIIQESDFAGAIITYSEGHVHVRGSESIFW